MAALATSLTEFSDMGNSRTFSVTGHTALKPKLVIQKRKVPTGVSGVAENDIRVVYGTTDTANVPLPQKVQLSITTRVPVNGTSSDATAALAVIRDIVASDEFGATFLSQNWLK